MAVITRRSTRDKSDLTHLYTDEDQGGPYEVAFDQWFTRRKRFHCIIDKAGGVVFRSRLVADIIDWLAAHDVKRYLATGGSSPWLVTLSKPPQKRKAKS